MITKTKALLLDEDDEDDEDDEIFGPKLVQHIQAPRAEQLGEEPENSRVRRIECERAKKRSK